MPKLHLTRNVLIVFFVPLGIVFVLALRPFLYYSSMIYWPDVVFAKERVHAIYETDDGTVIELTQFWNRSDFYTTRIKRIDPNGQRYESTVDGDDGKIWNARIEATDDNDQISVVINGAPRYAINVTDWNLRRPSGSLEWIHTLDRPEN